MIAMTKQLLRRQIRSKCGNETYRAAQSERLCQHILQSKEYQNAAIVGGYMPMRHEADILPVLRDVLESGRILLLPLCDRAPHMTLRIVTSLEALVVGAYGILEPAADSPVYQGTDHVLLLVPLEGIDCQGYRLGKGGGYYDRLLSQGNFVSLGCALDWQWTENLPRDAWDIPLNACADTRGIHYF